MSLDVPAFDVPTDEVLDESLPKHVDTMLHWTLLSVSAIVLLLAIVLQVRGEEQVIVPGVGIPLPGTCTFKNYIGADCPGCGLTRCFISTAHGQLSRAWHFNPVGIAFFVVVVSQIPFRTIQLWRIRRGLPEIYLGWWGYSLMLIVMVALLVQWVVRLAIYFIW